MEIQNERRWILGFALFVILVTTLPILIGFELQGSNHRFTGFVIGVEDGNSYLAKMLSGTYNEWLFKTPYTTYPQQGVFIYLPYILLGKLAGGVANHEQLIAIFQLFRVFACILEIVATYKFLSFFLTDLLKRRVGLALIILGGGLGWILVLLGKDQFLGSMPLDFYSPETFGFLAIFGIPHLAVARAFMLWTFVSYLRSTLHATGDPVSSKAIIKLSILWLIAGVMQPLTMVIIAIVIFIHQFGLSIGSALHKNEAKREWIGWRQSLRFVGWAGILPGIFVLYNAYIVFRDPFMQEWAKQNLIRSPNPAQYLFAYGLIIPLSVVGGYYLLKTNFHKGWFLVGWIIIFPAIAYAPVNLQRRLPDGVWVAWVTLAMLGFMWLDTQNHMKGRGLRKLAAVPLFLSFPSTIILIMGGFITTTRLTRPVYRDVDESKVYTYLANTVQPGSVVLCGYDTGNALPAWASVRVVIGHGPESAGLKQLLPEVAKFFSSNTPDIWREEFIEEHTIQYIFVGPVEYTLGDWDPSQADYLQPFFRLGEYQVFEVQNSLP
jgi:hypothetical protein